MTRTMARKSTKAALKCRLARSGAPAICNARSATVSARLGVNCQIAAPSLIPKKAGLKRKNDRLDAQHLAEYYRSGLLTLIHVPLEDGEAVRDLLRSRAQVGADQPATPARLGLTPL